MLHAKIFIMEVIGAGQDRNRGTMFLIIWNTLEEDTIKTNKSCISLVIIHSKGIPLIKQNFAHIDGISHSVDNLRIWLEIVLESAIINLSDRKEKIL